MPCVAEFVHGLSHRTKLQKQRCHGVFFYLLAFLPRALQSLLGITVTLMPAGPSPGSVFWTLCQTPEASRTNPARSKF